jgi:apolipoprotein N-acyltransferase
MTHHVAQVPGHPVDRSSWLWLAVGLALLPFSTVHVKLPLAAWLAPIFVMRFARTQSIRLGLPIVILVSGAAVALAWRDFFPGTPFGPVLGFGYWLAFSMAYVVDRLLCQRLSGIARTLVFPLTVTTIDWSASYLDLLVELWLACLHPGRQSPAASSCVDHGHLGTPLT